MFNRSPRFHAKIIFAVSMSLLMLIFSPVVLGHDEDTPMKTYQVELENNPAEVLAGEPFRLTLRISNSVDSTPVTEFDEVHTKLLHLIAVSEDLTTFLHLHPDYQGDGVFVLEDAELPQAANYIYFADFTPTGEGQQVVRLDLSTADARVSKPELVVGKHDDRVESLRFHLNVQGDLKTHEATALRFHITDAITGKPVDTLDEYLGASGHLVIIDEAGEIYLHTHPAGHDMHDMHNMAGMEMSYGPDIEFMTEFPAIGLYKMWLQVQYEDEIYTAPFVINVARESEAAPTQEAHHHH